MKLTKLAVYASATNKNNKAFTLLEVLIVLAVSSILLMMATPSLKNTVARNQADAHIQNLYRSWQQARSTAITKQLDVRVCGSNNGSSCAKVWNKYWLVFDDQDSNKIASATEVMQVVNFDLNQDRIISRFSFGLTSLSLNSRGQATLTGSFIYCPKSKLAQHIRRLTWSRTGRPYFARDSNHDGVIDDTNGKPMAC